MLICGRNLLSSLKFDSSLNQYGVISEASDLDISMSGNSTWSIWLTLTEADLSGAQILYLAKAGGVQIYNFGIHTTGHFLFQVYEPSSGGRIIILSSQVPKTNQLYHIYISKNGLDANNLIFKVNNIDEKSIVQNNLTSTDHTSVGGLVVGGSYNSAVSQYTGSYNSYIHSFAFWKNDGLTDSDCSALYKCGGFISAYLSTPTIYIPFYEKNGQTAYSTINSRNMSLNNYTDAEVGIGTNGQADNTAWCNPYTLQPYISL